MVGTHPPCGGRFAHGLIVVEPRRIHIRHCEQSEAIQSQGRSLDCVASLAMTVLMNPA
jgi:hypothetical protein